MKKKLFFFWILFSCIFASAQTKNVKPFIKLVIKDGKIVNKESIDTLISVSKSFNINEGDIYNPDKVIRTSVNEDPDYNPDKTVLTSIRENSNYDPSIAIKTSSFEVLNNYVKDKKGNSFLQKEENSVEILDFNKVVKLKSASEIGTKKGENAIKNKEGSLTGWETIVSEGFEGSFPGTNWNVYAGSGNTNAYWEDVNYKSYSGSWSGWCAGGGTQSVSPGSNYPNNMNAWMVYGPFNLSDANDASLTFKNWNITESGYDYFKYMVSINGTNFYGTQVSGNSEGWVIRSIDFKNVFTLGDVTGDTQVWIALIFVSDGSTVYEGSYVDDIILQKNTVASATPDLTCINIGLTTESWTVGNSVTATVTEVNNGTESAGSHSTRLYLSDNSTITTSDTQLGTDISYSSISAGGSQSQEKIFTVPDVTDGTYYVGVMVDFYNVVAESDESNNVLYRNGQVPVVHSVFRDLTSTSIGLTTESWVVGNSVTATVTEVNNGTESAGFHSTRLYLSDNSTITTSDTQLGIDISFGSISAGGSQSQEKIFTVPDVTDGTYYVGVMVDFYNVVAESDESNNILYRNGQVTVTLNPGPPDINVSPTSIAINQSSSAPITGHSSIWENGEEQNTSKNQLNPNNQILDIQTHEKGLIVPEFVKIYWKIHETPIFKAPPSNINSAVDWSGQDSPVKNQRTCGSCWAFAAIGLIENLGTQTDLSEQAIISCNTYGDDCSGGWHWNALAYVQSIGVPPETCYPYANDNGNCGNLCSSPSFRERVTTYTPAWGLWGEIATVANLKSILNNGPTVVTMIVPTDGSFDIYSGGIYNYSGGSIPWEENGHAVLCVGYDDNQQCFKVKNSWGINWGESGYFRIAYDDVTDDLHFGGYAVQASGVYTQNLSDNSFTISNTGGGNLSITLIIDNKNWLTTSGYPATPFNVAAGGSQSLNVSVDWSLVGSSTQTGTITISSNDPDEPSITVQVTAIPADICTLTVSSTSLSFTPIAETNTITITSTSSWSVVDNASWINVSPTSGTGNGQIQVNVTANSGSTSRSGNVSITGCNKTETITVTQEPCNLSVSPSTLTFTSSSGSKSVSVTSNSTWSVSKDAPWITVTPATGTGNGSITVTVTANTGASERRGTVTVSGCNTTKTIEVTQSTCNLSISPTSLDFTPAASTKSLSLTSNSSWTVSDNSSWITKSPSGGNGNATLSVTVTANSGSTRNGMVTVSGCNKTEIINITQFGEGPNLSVTPSNQNVPATPAGSTSFTVASNSSWTATSNQPWCTVTQSGSGTGTILANYSVNPGSQRTATITVTVQGLTPQTVTVTQSGPTPTLTVTPSNQNVPATPAGSTNFSVTSNSSWTATSNQTWCSVTPSGSGNGTIIANYAANTGSQRIATITVSVSGLPSQTVTITQSGPNPTLTVTPSNQNVPATPAGSTSFTVTSNSNWTATSNQPWCTVTLPGNGTIIANYTVNPGSQRIANITITVQGLTPQTVTVTQAAPPVCQHGWQAITSTNSTTAYCKVTIGNAPATTADKIGVFVGTECRGIGNIVVNNNEAYSTVNIQGISVESATFKIWDESDCKVLDACGTFTTNPGGIIGTPPNYLIINDCSDKTQSLTLASGWNLVSLYVNTGSKTPQNIFESIPGIQQVKNMTKSWDPSVPDFLNTLQSLTIGEGYFVKTQNSGTLQVTGPYIGANHSFNLASGWNLVGYPYEICQSVTVGLKTLLDNNKVLQLKNMVQSFDPAVPDFLNTLKYLSPGEGYFLNASSSASNFVIPEPTVCNKSAIINSISACGWQFTGYEKSMVAYGEITLNDLPITGEAYIGAFVGDECRSVIPLIQDKGKSYASMVINGNEKEEVTFRLCYNGDIYLSEYTIIANPGESTHSVARIPFRSAMTKNLGPELTASPNPFSRNLEIRVSIFDQDNVEVGIYNMNSQLIKSFHLDNANPGTYIFDWDSKDLSGNMCTPGMYFVRFIGNTGTAYQKVVLDR